MDFGSPREYFMQNKANFKKDRMNVKYYLQKDCENESRRRLWENKPNFQKTEDRSLPLRQAQGRL